MAVNLVNQNDDYFIEVKDRLDRLLELERAELDSGQPRSVKHRVENTHSGHYHARNGHAVD
jgi:hypothetical protein